MLYLSNDATDRITIREFAKSSGRNKTGIVVQHRGDLVCQRRWANIRSELWASFLVFKQQIMGSTDVPETLDAFRPRWA